MITSDQHRAEVRALCQRMLADLDALDESLEAHLAAHMGGPGPWGLWWAAPKLTGRARRTSMDLTRALAELRRR